MQFVLIFFVICLALVVCTLGNGLGALCVLALALTLIVSCVISHFDRLASIDRKLDAILEMNAKKDEKEEKNENA